MSACTPELARRVAEDIPVEPPPDYAGQPAVTAWDGFYAGTLIPGEGNPAGCAQSYPRTLLVVAGMAATGINYPLRGPVTPAGAATLDGPGDATLSGTFMAAGFRGELTAGSPCRYAAYLQRLP